MQTVSKLGILADAAKYDVSCASSGGKRDNEKGGIGNTNGMGIRHSYTPDGRCISLLKILLTNYCIYDCQFCINRVSSGTERARFSPQEVIDLTLNFYKRNYIEGLFLSSGIIQSEDYTMEQLISVAKSLRLDHKFFGYIHLKAIAGASEELLTEAGKYADRLSANIELPREMDLTKLAPAKKHSTIEKTMTGVGLKIKENKEDRSKRKSKFAPAGQSTQLIVGATDASDKDILEKSAFLYRQHSLKRIYYSAFSPIPDSAPGLPSAAIPLVREHGLYQADWLQRFYGFKVQELFNSGAENLSLSTDPKLSWALTNRSFFPININKAEKTQLLRVPGFGVRTVERILKARIFHSLSLYHLVKMHVPLNKAKPFIETSDYHPSPLLLDSGNLKSKIRFSPKQLSLFDKVSSISGEL